jgi:Ca2+-binding RTX toxin-like protein
MLRITVRSALRLATASLVALFALGAVTGTALATTISYSADATTLVVTGADNANHDIQFRANAGNDDIIDVVPFTSVPADCTAMPATPVPNTWFTCPGHVSVQVDLGAGNDGVTFGGSNADCFNGYTVNLGDGANTVAFGSGCQTDPAETGTVTSGSGPDTLTGGNQSAMTFNAGGGDDTVFGGTGNDVIHGGDGNDRLFGEAGNDQVLGEGGNDSPDGGAGNDVVNGGDGDDALEYSTGLGGDDTGAGADTYIGGAGTDKLWLDAHPGGMAISLDGVANDGVPGEGDNVGSDIESIDGTPGNDVFVGSAGPDQFSGEGGNDEIHGGAGNDDLIGGSGDDKLFGDAGNDKVQGSGGADAVDGGAGADQLYGDIASCSVFCSFDSDTISARDGEKDAVDCGGGADTATVDFIDVVAFCSSVDRAPARVPPPPPKVVFGVTTSGKLRIAKGLALMVRCSAKCRYKVAVMVSAKTAKRFGLGRHAITIGTVSGTFTAAGKKTRKLTLTAAARRKLKHAGSVPAILRITVTNPGAKASVHSKAITLHP